MWRLWTRQSGAIYLLNRRKHDRNVLSPTHNPHTHASYSVAGEVVVMVARGGGVNWRDFVARTGLWHPHFGGVCRYLTSVWERRTIYSICENGHPLCTHSRWSALYVYCDAKYAFVFLYYMYIHIRISLPTIYVNMYRSFTTPKRLWSTSMILAARDVCDTAHRMPS